MRFYLRINCPFTAASVVYKSVVEKIPGQDRTASHEINKEQLEVRILLVKMKFLAIGLEYNLTSKVIRSPVWLTAGRRQNY
jgi:hypothetical protein